MITCTRFFVAVGVATMITACSDDGSTDLKAGGLPAEVANKAELEAFVCGMDVVGEKVYVRDLGLNYECDGEKWFESYDQTKPGESSSSKKNSSSSDAGNSSMDQYLDEEGYTDIEEFQMPNEIVYYGHVEDSRDGQVYKTNKFAGQVWMAENLNYDYSSSHRLDSNALPQSWCYDDDPENCDKYGRLYTFEAAVDTDNICPQGWHLSGFGEWSAFVEAAGMPLEGTGVGGQYSSSLSTYWFKDSSGWRGMGGDNYMGFSAIPGGYRDAKGYFDEKDFTANFWTGARAISFGSTAFVITVSAKSFGADRWFTTHACSIRCLMDDTLNFVADSSTEEFFKPKAVVEFSGNDGSEYDPKSNTLKDLRDGHVYKTTTISFDSVNYQKVWMAENLDYAYLQPTASEDSSSWCYDGDADNCKKYGRLYLWSAAMDSAGVFSEANNCGYRKTCNHKKKTRGVCPSGWHLPSKRELKTFHSLATNSYLGGLIRAVDGWDNCEECTDKFGLSILPSGYRGLDRHFYSIGEETRIWLSTESSTNQIDNALLAESYYVGLKYDGSGREMKNEAFPIRCIKDSE